MWLCKSHPAVLGCVTPLHIPVLNVQGNRGIIIPNSVSLTQQDWFLRAHLDRVWGSDEKGSRIRASLREAPIYVHFSLFQKRSPVCACAAERGLGKEHALKAIPVLPLGCALHFTQTELGPISSAWWNMALWARSYVRLTLVGICASIYPKSQQMGKVNARKPGPDQVAWAVLILYLDNRLCCIFGVWSCENETLLVLTHRGFAHWENGQIPLENGEPPAGRTNESSLLPKKQNFISLREKDWLSLMEIPPLLPISHTHKYPNLLQGSQVICSLYLQGVRWEARVWAAAGMGRLHAEKPS